MNAREEINSMVKSAGKFGPALSYFDKFPAQDEELGKLIPKKRQMSEGERFYADEARRRQENKSRQQALSRQGAPAGRSVGSGYTGNEIRHGGTYASKGQVAWGAGNAGNYQNMEQWKNSPTYQLMQGKRTMSPYSDIKDRNGNIVRSARQQYEDSFLPNNPRQYTYAGSQPMADHVTSGRYAQQQGMSGSEFASDSDQGVEGNAYRGRIIPRTQGKIVERRVGAQVNPPPRPPAKVPTAAPAVQNARHPSPPPPPPPPPPPAPAPKQVAGPRPAPVQPAKQSLPDEDMRNTQWSDFTGVNNMGINQSPYARLQEIPGMYPLRPSQPVHPQIQQSISDEDVADINDYVKNLQNSPDQMVPDATKSRYSADRYLRENGLDTLEDLFR